MFCCVLPSNRSRVGLPHKGGKHCLEEPESKPKAASIT